MKYRYVSPQKIKMGAIGLGCMGMSDFYGPADRKESLATINRALDDGVNWIDTGDFYGMGQNELLIGEVAKKRRDDMFIAVKFGAQRAPDGSFIGIDTRPNSVKNFLTYSLQRLGVDHIDLYQPSRISPAIPIEETVGAIAQMIERGYVKHLGLSEAGIDTIRRAHAVHPVSFLQIEYSLVSRSVEHKILPVIRELGIGLSAYGILSRGLLAGNWQLGKDYRSRLPRFSGKNLDKNLHMVHQLKQIADELNVTTAQLAIAWVLQRGDDIIPLVGARTRVHLAEALMAQNIVFEPEILQRIEQIVSPDKVAGDRYPANEMKLLDSERGNIGASL